MIIIHHGLGVTQGLSEYIEDNGLKQVKPAYEKLNADGVRNLVADLKQIYPINKPCLIAGPLDDADFKVLDTLLKIIEEPIPNTPELILWAYDLGSVPLTIRSRCGEKYWFGVDVEHKCLSKAKSLIDALIEKDYQEVLSVVKSLGDLSERDLIEALCELAVQDENLLRFYPNLKHHLSNKRINKLGLYSILSDLLSYGEK